jgi:16S rRNA (guanine527-N7)-methyltransferase
VKPQIEELCRILALPAKEGQIAAAADFLGLLAQWNSVYNLTSVREAGGMLTQHLADCLAVVPSIEVHGVQGRVLDVGSGGGLPGVVLAIFMPHLQVCCVDAVGKKAAFIRQVAGVLRLGNLSAIHGRVEDLQAPPFDLVISRAFATLDKFVQLTERAVREGGVRVAMKGRVPDDEINALPDRVEVFHVEHLKVPGLDAQRCLIWMRARDARNTETASTVI